MTILVFNGILRVDPCINQPEYSSFFFYLSRSLAFYSQNYWLFSSSDLVSTFCPIQKLGNIKVPKNFKMFCYINV